MRVELPMSKLIANDLDGGNVKMHLERMTQMTRQTLIYKIIQSLHDEGALDVHNYLNYIEQVNDMYNIIERVLDNIVLIEGEVLQ